MAGLDDERTVDERIPVPWGRIGLLSGGGSGVLGIVAAILLQSSGYQITGPGTTPTRNGEVGAFISAEDWGMHRQHETEQDRSIAEFNRRLERDQEQRREFERWVREQFSELPPEHVDIELRVLKEWQDRHERNHP